MSNGSHVVISEHLLMELLVLNYILRADVNFDNRIACRSANLSTDNKYGCGPAAVNMSVPA